GRSARSGDGTWSPHCTVRTAMLVLPTMAPFAVLNRMYARLTPGRKGTSAMPCTNAANVSVWLAVISTNALELGVGGLMQAPVTESVWQSEIATGRTTSPVSTVTAIVAVAPTLTVATEKNPVPAVPGMLTMPSFVVVAPRATMSGPGETVDAR